MKILKMVGTFIVGFIGTILLILIFPIAIIGSGIYDTGKSILNGEFFK